VANEYVSLVNLKLALKIVNNTSRDTLLDYVRAAASKGVEAYTGRRFYADSSASARTYRIADRLISDDDGGLLLVDDISATTDLVVKVGTAGSSTYTTLASTEYEAWPDNAIARDQPIQGFRRVGGTWGGPMARAQITARWGWPAVPDVVVEATLLQAIRLWSRKDSPQGVLGSAEFGAILVSRMDPDVKPLLRHLVIPGFG
jgi:hypothetical protein